MPLLVLLSILGTSLALHYGSASGGKPSDVSKTDATIRSAHSLAPRERGLWMTAMREARLNGSDISVFGSGVAKYPRSWVDQVMALDRVKRRKFNFQGSVFTKSQMKRRAWVVPFVQKHFGDEDFMRITDAPKDYVPLGRFDVTGTPGGYRPMSVKLNNRTFFDKGYFESMTTSKFTLCPGGDMSWSMRLHEAILSGSIPVINSVQDDFNPPHPPGKHNGMLDIGYRYVMADSGPFVYDEEMANENLRLFMKYQTFLEGDHVPAGAEE